MLAKRRRNRSHEDSGQVVGVLHASGAFWVSLHWGSLYEVVQGVRSWTAQGAGSFVNLSHLVRVLDPVSALIWHRS